ncbi:hypothetical protein CDL12_00437 [Handroanthus impetiginosus]|uniref:ER membrane protein complex subunit 6 n=1 Tax=Handroanthus impetiginosus TaxID=429701 RepID=A0A2G9IAM8_9LAMI|nr:hypothetical protein CDL12_00437 [Handroanthus impetiginosus]
MAVHEDSSAHKKKSSMQGMRYRLSMLKICRTTQELLIIGILGFTGLMGFIFYFVVMAITTGGLAAKTGFSIHSYFDSWNRIVFDGILGGLLLTYSYPLLHEYMLHPCDSAFSKLVRVGKLRLGMQMNRADEH